MGLSSNDSRHSVSAPDVADRPLIAVVCLDTGYVGCDSTELQWFDTGENIADSTHEQAQEYASSWGHDGTYTCNECGELSDDSNQCDSCGSDNVEWEASENVSGWAYLFNPLYHMGYTAGGDDESALVRLLFEAGMLVQEGTTIKANTSMIVAGMAGERADIIKNVDAFIRGASYLYGTFTRIVWE